MKFMLVVALLVGAAWYFLKPLPPGMGPDADLGRKRSGMLISAVETYRSERGMYPMSLEDMVPDLISGVPHLPNGSSFDYQRLGTTYKLTFNYSNPLPVHCTYQPASRWACEWF